ncbi:hypothetical protein PTI45_04504 [Paenibacillus nuruki]|uniref:Uncharacterized protein n=2 Tax=Paenibacillus nuruki TaxID=1886670 RepID=A0A1E3KX84_9BACL|nr:hypothetical protein PTI45_04504 [Paenibacillus nuruki]
MLLLKPDPHVWLLSLQRISEVIQTRLETMSTNESLSCLFSLCEYFIHKIQQSGLFIVFEPTDIIVITAITEEHSNYIGEMYPLEDFEQGKESKEELLSSGFIYTPMRIPQASQETGGLKIMLDWQFVFNKVKQMDQETSYFKIGLTLQEEQLFKEVYDAIQKLVNTTTPVNSTTIGIDGAQIRLSVDYSKLHLEVINFFGVADPMTPYAWSFHVESSLQNDVRIVQQQIYKDSEFYINESPAIHQLNELLLQLYHQQNRVIV